MVIGARSDFVAIIEILAELLHGKHRCSYLARKKPNRVIRTRL